ncbi:MAG: DUF4058 family protein [Planctomycetota bacterium]|nr:DUF4058 family protein [Planctomycetota bacterium]
MTKIADKNPFPGMNPYLEQYWRDVHTRLMIYLCDQVQGQLPAGLWASVEEQVTVDAEDDERARSFHPDVHIGEDWLVAEGLRSSGTAVAEPLVLIEPSEKPQRYVQIVDAGGRVVTAVEVLSRTNKLADDGRRAYRRKQRAYLEGGVNLVEIDLVRDGAHIVLAPLEQIQPSLRTPYWVSIWRVAQPEARFAYPLPRSQPLPRIPLPLRRQDSDAVVDLQELIELCYDRGRYHARIDYRLDPEPPLPAADARWADELLRGLGLRC